VAELVESLMAIPGAVAVAHARREDGTGPGAPGGQRRYLLYYRGELDAAKLRGLEHEAEVISRDLASVEHRMTEAGEGRFAIEAVDDWLAGIPTYTLVAELATCEVLSGELPRPEFPAALREPAARRWREVATRALEVAESLASRADVAGCGGQLAKASIATAHARLAQQGEWVLGEAGIVRRAGLGRSEAILAATGDRPLDLERAVTRMRVALGLSAAEARETGPDSR
jgi:hypothetical protein